MRSKIIPCLLVLVSLIPAAAISGEIHNTVQQGDSVRLRSLIVDDPGLLEDRDERGRTPLHLACGMGKADMVRILLESGADPELRDSRGASCLMSASEGRSMEVVNLLVARGADLQVKVESQGMVYNLLTISAMYNFAEFTDYLIDRDIPLEEGGFGITLRYAVIRNMPNLIDYVQRQGLTDEEMIALVPDLICDAASRGSAGIVETLVDKGYSLSGSDWCGWTPLHHAAYGGNVEVVRYLLGRKVDRGARNLKGENAYDLAASSEASEAATLLAEAGFDTTGPVFPELRGPYMGQSPPGDTPEMFLPGIVSGRDRGHSPVVFTPDGKEAYWTEMGRRTQVMMKMALVDGIWRAPASTGLWGDPGLSPDGGRMAMISRVERSGGEGGSVDHIYYMDREGGGWSEPVSAGDRVNSKTPHWRPSLDGDRNLYFSTFADSMYFAPYSGGKYGRPVSLIEHMGNGTLHGYAPFISPEGDYLLFSDDNRAYVSYRGVDGKWCDRIDLGGDINLEGASTDLPVATPDGKYIFFLGHGSEREWGIYWVSAEILQRLRP